MDGLSDIEEMNVDYESLKEQHEGKLKKNSKVYEITNYKTVKENNIAKPFLLTIARYYLHLCLSFQDSSCPNSHLHPFQRNNQ